MKGCILKTSMKRELDFVYHIDIRNIVYKGKNKYRSKVCLFSGI